MSTKPLILDAETKECEAFFTVCAVTWPAALFGWVYTCPDADEFQDPAEHCIVTR